MKLFPPIVTGTVVCLIGLTLLPVSIDWAAGGVGIVMFGTVAAAGISTGTIVALILNLVLREAKEEIEEKNTDENCEVA